MSDQYDDLSYELLSRRDAGAAGFDYDGPGVWISDGAPWRADYVSYPNVFDQHVCEAVCALCEKMAPQEWRQLTQEQKVPWIAQAIDAERNRNAPQAQVADEPQAEAKSSVSLDARALGLFIENTNLTKKEIAARLDCHEKSLAPKRCPKLNAAIKASTAKIDPGNTIRGTKDADGNVEAWSEE